MKIKTKITLGVGLLFLLIIILSAVGAGFISALKADTDNILVANYNSLEYSRVMLNSLEAPTPENLKIFEDNLKKQSSNLTEIGEGDITDEITNHFNEFKQNNNDSNKINLLRKGIYKIMNLNMQAIQRKSIVAKATADKAVFWIAITGALCFLIAFTLLINLPSSIANPIKELTASIKNIAAKKYSERVHFESHSEYGELARSFNVMAEKLEEYNNSNLAHLMKEKKRIETLINNMHDPVIGLDENLKVIFANEEAIKITGISHKDFIGNHCKDLAQKNDLMRTLVQEILEAKNNIAGKNNPLKIYSDNKEGYFEKTILQISATPTGEQEKQIIGHVILLKNITEYKELDFAKTNFIATVSHEFKTPISSIKMSLQLLENEKIGKLNEEQVNLLDSIKEDANRLLKITGELLNITQVESGNIQLSIIPTDPKEIVLYAINATKTQAEQKQIKLEINCEESVPKVHADNEKTAWVLTNLISNAIRYSYDNATVKVNLYTKDNKVNIEVCDSGQGIAPQYKDKIFERYFRVPGTKKEGTGLGLSISKEFIEAQGGNIELNSDFGKGSVFSITLNVA
jgi:two-component system, NtrC family, sensor histidine kinase KinB